MKRQAAGLAGGRAIAAGLQALLFIALARAVDPVAFGAVNVLLNVLTVASIVVAWGGPQMMLRLRASGQDDDVLALYKLELSASLIYGVCVFGGVAVLALSGVLPGDIAVAAAVIAVATWADRAADTRVSVQIADGSVHAPSTNVVLRRLLSVALYFALVWLAPSISPLVAFGSAFALGNVAGLIIAHIGTRHSRQRGPRAQSQGMAIRAGFPYMISNLTAQARTLDVVLIGWASGLATAGLYSAAYRVASPLLLPTAALASSVVPAAVRIEVEDRKRLVRRLSAGHVLVALVLTPIAWACSFLLPVLLGPSYAAAAPVFVVLVASMPLVGLSSVLGAVAQAQGLARYVAVNGVIYLGVLLVFVAIGALIGGATAAAAAVGLAYALKCSSLFVRLNFSRESVRPASALD